MTEFLSVSTNEALTAFVLNNILAIYMVQKVVEYVVKKTPWAVDDDLPSFTGGLVNTIKKGKDPEK